METKYKEQVNDLLMKLLMVFMLGLIAIIWYFFLITTLETYRIVFEKITKGVCGI